MDDQKPPPLRPGARSRQSFVSGGHNVNGFAEEPDDWEMNPKFQPRPKAEGSPARTSTGSSRPDGPERHAERPLHPGERDPGNLGEKNEYGKVKPELAPRRPPTGRPSVRPGAGSSRPDGPERQAERPLDPGERDPDNLGENNEYGEVKPELAPRRPPTGRPPIRPDAGLNRPVGPGRQSTAESLVAGERDLDDPAVETVHGDARPELAPRRPPTGRPPIRPDAGLNRPVGPGRQSTAESLVAGERDLDEPAVETVHRDARPEFAPRRATRRPPVRPGAGPAESVVDGEHNLDDDSAVKTGYRDVKPESIIPWRVTRRPPVRPGAGSNYYPDRPGRYATADSLVAGERDLDDSAVETGYRDVKPESTPGRACARTYVGSNVPHEPGARVNREKAAEPKRPEAGFKGGWASCELV